MKVFDCPALGEDSFESPAEGLRDVITMIDNMPNIPTPSPVFKPSLTPLTEEMIRGN